MSASERPNASASPGQIGAIFFAAALLIAAPSSHTAADTAKACVAKAAETLPVGERVAKSATRPMPPQQLENWKGRSEADHRRHRSGQGSRCQTILVSLCKRIVARRVRPAHRVKTTQEGQPKVRREELSTLPKHPAGFTQERWTSTNDASR
jgi:hypothetical protein